MDNWKEELKKDMFMKGTTYHFSSTHHKLESFIEKAIIEAKIEVLKKAEIGNSMTTKSWVIAIRKDLEEQLKKQAI